MRRALALWIALAGCRSEATPDAAPAPKSLPCGYGLKEGDPCEEPDTCKPECAAPTATWAYCSKGRWHVYDVICEPPPRSDVGTPTSPENETVGRPCSSDVECDPLELGTGFCTGAFPQGPVFATAVCITSDCTPGKPCSGGRGMCTAGLCLPRCAFDNATLTGCSDKSACFATGARDTSTGDAGLSGSSVYAGFCYGGCRSDDDCSAGAVCQPESGHCVKTRATFAKPLGDRCKPNDPCPCRADAVTELGFCSRLCRVGDSCPDGWLCDPNLPEGVPAPPGLGGWCSKPCASDTDCTALNARCVLGSVGKVCRVTPPLP